MTEPIALGCIRVVDAREVAAGSTQAPCAECHEPVWVSKASREAAGPTAVLLCVACLSTKTVRTVMPPTPAQLGEIIGHVRRN